MSEKTVTKKEVKKTPETASKKVAKLAIIQTGGKQYIVKEGQVLKIEKLPQKMIKDNKVEFDQVLMIFENDKINLGKPIISGKKVAAEIIKEGRAKKISVIHYKSKSRYFKKNGHRQPFHQIKIVKIG